jgi:hypothetical protein
MDGEEPKQENLKAFVLKIYLRLAEMPLSSKDEVLRPSFRSVDTTSLSSMAVKENSRVGERAENRIVKFRAVSWRMLLGAKNPVSGESESENCWWFGIRLLVFIGLGVATPSRRTVAGKFPNITGRLFCHVSLLSLMYITEGDL